MKIKVFNNSEYYITLFESKNQAIHLYYILERKGYCNFQLVSTPCNLKAGCSYSIKFNKLDDFKIIKQASDKLKMKITDVYIIKRNKGDRTIKRIENLF